MLTLLGNDEIACILSHLSGKDICALRLVTRIKWTSSMIRQISRKKIELQTKEIASENKCCIFDCPKNQAIHAWCKTGSYTHYRMNLPYCGEHSATFEMMGGKFTCKGLNYLESYE